MVRATGTPSKSAKTTPKQLMENVPEDKVFWNQDGQIFRNVRELANGFMKMSDETFKSHVSKSKNDFAMWVRDVIGDKELAKDLEKTMKRTDSAKIVELRIKAVGSTK